jgi:hypothetical protein
MLPGEEQGKVADEETLVLPKCFLSTGGEAPALGMPGE